MPKSPVNTLELAESDFRKIQKLLSDKYEKNYSLDYIRKVCKGKRNNDTIKEMAEKYTLLIQEMEHRIKNLSKS